MTTIETIDDTAPETLSRFDAIIDVRSPGEYAEDHIPGAVNLPVLNNEQRVEVGTIYKQQSKFTARRIGGAYVAHNIADHLDAYFHDKPRDFHPLINCWRGGMRSGAMATVLAKVGWRSTLLQGGYKTWRRSVVDGLHGDDGLFNLILIDGQTGAGKTDILQRAGEIGAQVLDLEHHAAHRGSVFGADASRDQPSQKYFESLLWNDLQKFDPKRPIFVEAESNRIHRRQIPKRLWASMRSAPHVIIKAPPMLRAQAIVKQYREIIDKPGAICSAIERLRAFHPKELIEEWLSFASDREFTALAHSLIEHHYDPLYDRSRKHRAGAALATIKLLQFDEISIGDAAREMIAAVT